MKCNIGNNICYKIDISPSGDGEDTMNEKVDDKLKHIQLLEQNMQMLHQQKQQFQAQLVEVESALKELVKSTDSYKIVGNIMVSSDKEKLLNELKEKKESVELRITTLEKQEKQMKDFN